MDLDIGSDPLEEASCQSEQPENIDSFIAEHDDNSDIEPENYFNAQLPSINNDIDSHTSWTIDPEFNSNLIDDDGSDAYICLTKDLTTHASELFHQLKENNKHWNIKQRRLFNTSIRRMTTKLPQMLAKRIPDKNPAQIAQRISILNRLQSITPLLPQNDMPKVSTEFEESETAVEASAKMAELEGPPVVSGCVPSFDPKYPFFNIKNLSKYIGGHQNPAQNYTYLSMQDTIYTMLREYLKPIVHGAISYSLNKSRRVAQNPWVENHLIYGIHIQRYLDLHLEPRLQGEIPDVSDSEDELAAHELIQKQYDSIPVPSRSELKRQRQAAKNSLRQGVYERLGMTTKKKTRGVATYRLSEESESNSSSEQNSESSSQSSRSSSSSSSSSLSSSSSSSSEEDDAEREFARNSDPDEAEEEEEVDGNESS